MSLEKQLMGARQAEIASALLNGISVKPAKSESRKSHRLSLDLSPLHTPQPGIQETGKNTAEDELKKAIRAVKESIDDRLPKEDVSDDSDEVKAKPEAKQGKGDYKGPTLLPADDYSRHTSIYKQFFAGHISRDTSAVNYAEVMDDVPKNSMGSDVEAISYKERKDFVRTIQMNALMGAMHNAVDPQIKEAYEMWKYASKFNQLMSFMMYEKVLSPN
jgi:hypothetical protein